MLLGSEKCALQIVSGIHCGPLNLNVTKRTIFYCLIFMSNYKRFS